MLLRVITVHGSSANRAWSLSLSLLRHAKIQWQLLTVSITLDTSGTPDSFSHRLVACLLATAGSSIVPSAAAAEFVSVTLRSMGSLTWAGYVEVVKRFQPSILASLAVSSVGLRASLTLTDRIKQHTLVIRGVTILQIFDSITSSILGHGLIWFSIFTIIFFLSTGCYNIFRLDFYVI